MHRVEAVQEEGGRSGETVEGSQYPFSVKLLSARRVLLPLQKGAPRAPGGGQGQRVCGGPEGRGAPRRAALAARTVALGDTPQVEV